VVRNLRLTLYQLTNFNHTKRGYVNMIHLFNFCFAETRRLLSGVLRNPGLWVKRGIPKPWRGELDEGTGIARRIVTSMALIVAVAVALLHYKGAFAFQVNTDPDPGEVQLAPLAASPYELAPFQFRDCSLQRRSLRLVLIYRSSCQMSWKSLTRRRPREHGS
jgi:hypothetical protein